jgi:hypothetical protein
VGVEVGVTVGSGDGVAVGGEGEGVGELRKPGELRELGVAVGGRGDGVGVAVGGGRVETGISVGVASGGEGLLTIAGLQAGKSRIKIIRMSKTDFGIRIVLLRFGGWARPLSFIVMKNCLYVYL